MNQYDVEELAQRPVSAIEVQYVNQTHEGDLLRVYSCETGDADTDAFTIELDGRTVVNCQITRQI